jgi:hypothetical protein
MLEGWQALDTQKKFLTTNELELDDRWRRLNEYSLEPKTGLLLV